MADVAFLVMDFAFHGRRDLAGACADAWFRATGDDEGRALLPLYVAYRCAVRARVEGIRSGDPSLPGPERRSALARSRAHWLFALGELDEPGRRPCLVLVGGLPGCGKSTLARALARQEGFAVVRSDAVRKELAGAAGEGTYAPGWDERTYGECLRRAERLLFEGRRVLVDATFRAEADRRRFLDAAAARGVPGLLLLCRAGPEAVRARLAARRGDASDAGWQVYKQAARRWEEPGPATRPRVVEVAAGGAREEALAQAVEALRRAGLAGRA